VYMFDNYEGKPIVQGTSGELKFSFKNPYKLSMDNVSLTINIYGLSTLETYEDIDENFKNPPIIEKANSLDTKGLILPIHRLQYLIGSILRIIYLSQFHF